MRKALGTFGLLCAGLLLLSGADSSPVTVVDDFSEPVQNRLGGLRDVYQAQASSAKLQRSQEIYRGQSGASLCIQADKRAEGFCGAWIHFFDMRQAQRKYFDATPFAYLSFWVKGQAGGEVFTIKLADQNWIQKEDSISIGDTRQFLLRGVTTEWTEVLIPLARVKQLDLKNLGGITLDFTTPGQQTVYIDDLCFKTTSSATTPASSASKPVARSTKPTKFSAPPGGTAPATGKAIATPETRHPRAMWMWSAQHVLTDPNARHELFEFCAAEGIEQLWVQLPYSIDRSSSAGPAGPETTAAVRCEIGLVLLCRKALAP